MMIHRKQNGFSLIEVMVSLVIFALGLLGVAQSVAKGIHINIDNNSRAIAASVVTQVSEPLYIAAHDVNQGTLSELDFKNLLININTTAVISGNNGLDDFQISVLESKDNNNLDVLANDPPAAGYAMPIRAVIEISYMGLSNTSTTKSNYTFVW